MESLVIAGPPASGKSRLAMERFRAVPGSVMVVPTATMAEHLAHEFARQGEFVRPSRIVTLAGLLDQWADSKAAPKSLLRFLVARALEQSAPRRFAPVADSRGLHDVLAGLIDELPSDAALPRDIDNLRALVVAGLERRGLATRATRAAEAAEYEGSLQPHYVFDGFFQFSKDESRLVRAIAAKTTVTLTFPEPWPNLPCRQTSQRYRQASLEKCEAATPFGEAAEVARRILSLANQGVPFRQMGVIVRSQSQTSALLESTLQRYGVPVRTYFPQSMLGLAPVGYLCELMQAILTGWDWEAIARGFRYLPPNADRDQFDVWLRNNIPGRGLLLPPGIDPPDWQGVASLERWATEQCSAAEWSERIGMVCPEAALVLAEAALAFEPSARLPLQMFWAHAKDCIESGQTYTRDTRRDVVHLMDAHEARQWELRHVFVCGLVEQEFPQYHSDSPILEAETLRRLGLDTAASRQEAERGLFEVALTRATESTVLSYSKTNEKGQSRLPSFFLPEGPLQRAATNVLPKPTEPVPHSRSVFDNRLSRKLERQHKRLSPSGIESFLQCPFQFLGRNTLRLDPLPPAPRDRATFLFQGGVIHKVLAEWMEQPILGSDIFDKVFEEACARAHLPGGYRTEAVRLEMLRNFQAFLEDRTLTLHWPARTELEFLVELEEGFSLKGQMDRIDIGPGRRALVIDYKYSAGNKVRERVEESEAGNLVQGGLYMLAARLKWGYEPIGMLYCGLKKPITWGGWHTGVDELAQVGEARTADGIEDVIAAARRLAVESHSKIVQGDTTPRPAAIEKCRFCDFRDICRIEATESLVRVAGGGS